MSNLLPLVAAALVSHSQVDAVTGAKTFQLWDGSTATVNADGVAVQSHGPADKRGSRRLISTFTPPGANDLSLFKTLSLPERGLAPQRVTAGVRNDFFVGSMATTPFPLDDATTVALRPSRFAAGAAAGVPSNYGVATSLQAHLNAPGVNAIGAFVELAQRYGQLPGQGIRITNVSVGDLIDQSMADSGDYYAFAFGANSRVIDGQRYLDYPSMPLIPTFVSDAQGKLDPVGTVEFVDPYQAEILLDFSVMAPLPTELQRPEARGEGRTDLLGIAPGAEYRLVVPQDPTMTNIYTALLAAATQQPRPDVITASLGFGFDGAGFPGRYLEDDPVGQSVIASIVKMGIVVCISANDGTRLFTPAAIGPDGGSAATDRLRPGETPTSVDDDFFSTAPTRVADSGAIAVGGTTLDDIFSAPPQAGGPLARVGVFPATRFNGSQGFSTGFGTRIDVSGPSDGIVALLHVCLNWPDCQVQDAIPVLNGGTSASAPMVAAAAAVVLQAARLKGVTLTPAMVRDILVRTGKPVAQAPQSGRTLQVGTQLDVTAALEEVLGKSGAPSIARVSVSHRRALGQLGAEYEEDVDRSAIDLSGLWAYGPITISADVVGAPASARYRLTAGKLQLTSATPSFRVLPSEIVASGSTDVRIDLVDGGGTVVTSASTRLGFGSTDGLVDEPLAPATPAVANEGEPVVVHYDVRSVRTLDKPALVISGIGHFSPTAAPLYHDDREIALPGVAGDVVVPPSAFRSGAGLYGIAIRPQAGADFIGQFAVIRIAARSGGRPEAPLLSDGSDALGHFAAIRSASGKFRMKWDASAYGAAAILEVSAPAPTLRRSYNTFTNANGSARDADGVNSGSTVFVPIAARGDRTFDALELGLSGGMVYSVRVFAAKNGKPSSEASATSMLEIDDVVLPGTMISFDLAAGNSTVATVNLDGYGMPIDSSFSRWSAATGDVAAIATDTAGNVYEDIGSDGRVTMAAKWPWASTTQTLESWDVAAGEKRASVDVDFAQAYLMSSRVDPVRRRAVFLAFDENFNEVLLPVDMASASLGAPVVVPGWSYSGVSLDPATGKAWLASLQFSEFCLHAVTPLALVDVDTGDAVTSDIAKCSTGMTADGKQVQLVDGPLLSNGVLLPVAQGQRVNEQTLKATDPALLGGRSPMFPTVDPVNRLLFVAFVAGSDFGTNNNATSMVAAFEPNSGARLWSSSAFNFARVAFGALLDSMPMRGIQLDPKTRTGWTFGPDSTQLQRFRY